jgi:hypothetical protein
MKLLDFICGILFWIIWIPVCIILIIFVVVIAYLHMIYDIIVGLFKRKNDK